MKKMFKKLLAIVLLSCAMLSAILMPSYASSQMYNYFCNPAKEDQYGSRFSARLGIEGDYPEFIDACASGMVATKSHSISLQPVYMIAIVQATTNNYTSSIFMKKVVECGVMQTYSNYPVVANLSDKYSNLNLDGANSFAGGALASNSNSDTNSSRLPSPISSTFNWWKGVSADDVWTAG